MTPAPAIHVARAIDPTTAGASAAAPAHASGAGGTPDGDAIYDEILRRLREEQEQLGHLIDHPF